jgi:hypothetical protein
MLRKMFIDGPNGFFTREIRQDAGFDRLEAGSTRI